MTCSGPSTSQCLSCKSDAKLVNGICTCKDGNFYPNPTSAACESCDSACLTCASAGSLQCISCHLGAQLQGPAPNSCICKSNSPDPTACVICAVECLSCDYTAPNKCTECPAEMYLNSGKCQTCPFTCSECSGSSCKSCFSPALLSAQTPNLCICPEGYYSNPDPTNCSKCHETCGTCYGSTAQNCLSCHSPAVQSGQECLCQGGSYWDGSKCQVCDLTCATCSKFGTNFCLSCHPNAVLFNPAPSLCQCLPAHFPSPDLSKCTPCHSSCVACSAPGTRGCTVCGDKAVLTGLAPAACICIDGYKGNEGTGCKACPLQCRTCANNGCTACFAGAALTKSFSCECSANYTPSPDASLCLACDSTCSATSGRLPCIANCSSCVNQVCSLCKSGFSLSASNDCLSSCPNGFYSSQGKCLPCKFPCLVCSSAVQCLSCGTDYSLVLGKCMRMCPSQQYSLNDSLCTQCAEKCLACTGPSACSICEESYYPQAGVCTQCSDCLTCNQLGWCLSCKQGMVLNIAGQCKTCEDCAKPLEITISSPKKGVLAVAFSRGVNYTFAQVDFVVTTKPPTLGLNWTVTNNPADGFRRLQVALTSLVHIRILSGNWTSDMEFEVAFSEQVALKDEFGVDLPSLKSTIPAPEGPLEVSNSDSGNDGEIRKTGLIIGVVLAIALALGVTALVVTCIYCSRLRKRTKVTMAVKQKYELAMNSSQQSFANVPVNSLVVE